MKLASIGPASCCRATRDFVFAGRGKKLAGRKINRMISAHFVRPSFSSEGRKAAAFSLDPVFRNPPAAYRGKPLWAWNGRLGIPELRRQVRIFAEMGMGGYFMHSRVGLKTEYLGKAWFRAIEACADEGARLGLESWLYDEDRWPSGSAGGLVTEDPAFRMRYLRCEVTGENEVPASAEESPVIAAFAGVVNGTDLSRYRRLPWPGGKLERGESLLLFREELVQPHGFFNGGTYLDTLNPEAVRRFLQLTHERYRVRAGDRFGKSIPGIFTDEPHRGFVMADTPRGWTYPPNSGWVTPWTAGFAGEFRRRFGYDLRERLPELFFRWQKKRLSPVKWHYMEALHGLFLKSWAQPCHEWCERHGLRLTGHMLGEESPGAQAVTCGSAMRYYEFLETPGMDLLGLDNRAFWIAKQVVSVARQLGRKWTMSELYGCTGWQATFADHKEIGDWQAFLGINLRCHHLSWYTMAGESKRDFPGSIFFQSAWYREYRAVEDYYARLHLLLQQGKPVCDLLVLHPVESVWAQIHAGWGGWIKSEAPGAARVDRQFETTFRWITAAGFDFDYGDEEQLGRLGRVEKGRARLRLGRGSYRAVLVCGLETIRGSTLKLLRDFRSAGGTVIFAGPPPSHVDAVKSGEARELCRQSTGIGFARAALISSLASSVPPLARLENATISDPSRPVLLQTRRHGKSWTVAVCNTDPAKAFPRARLVFCGGVGSQVQEWDCRTGKKWEVPHERRNGELRWSSPLPPLGERVFRITPAGGNLPVRVSKRAREREIPGPFPYRLDEPNALVLDRFEWRLGRRRWSVAEDILSLDRMLRERMGYPQRSLGMVQPWARREAPRQSDVTLSLRARFAVRGGFPTTVLLENPERWQVSVNGLALSVDHDDGWFVDPCFRKIPLPRGVLREGENVISLSARFGENLDLEAIYLLGDFGVFFAKAGIPALKKLPVVLGIGDVCRQGLPFYTGRIRYEVALPAGKTGTRRFRLPAFGGAVAGISAPEQNEPQILGFPPYEAELPERTTSLACEIVLTRRNLFGPLHWNVGNKNFVTPDSFRSTGKAYSIPALLEPSGLLAPPLIA